MSRLVPAYVEIAGWEVWNAFDAWTEDQNEADRLVSAVIALGEALVRAQALTYAPDEVLDTVMA